MDSSSREIIERNMTRSAIELFGAYGVDLRVAPAAALEDAVVNIASVIGFTSSRLRGSTAIATSRKVTGLTLPAGIDGADWLGELANQLLGRFKNMMFACDVDLTLSTPLSIFGRDLRFSLNPGSDSFDLMFECEHGIVAVSLNGKLNGEALVEREQSEDEAAHSAGDMMLF